MSGEDSSERVVVVLGLLKPALAPGLV